MDEITPHDVFTLFDIPVRDTVMTTWIMIAIVLLISVVIHRRQPVVLETLVDFLHDTISDIMGRPAEPFLPFLGSLAIFIAAANVIDIIPLLNAPTRDINTPLALAVVVFFSVHYFGIRSRGLLGYLKGLASPIFLLPLEIIGQLSRTLSLTLRLFGNIFSAVLIVTIVVSLVPLIVPLPLIGLSLFTGLLQAYIFTALAAVYIGAGLGDYEPQKEEPSSEE